MNVKLRTKNDVYGDGLWWSRGPSLGSGSFGSVYMATSFDFPPDIMAVKSAKVSDSKSLQFEKMVFDQLRGCPDHIIQCFGDEWTTSEGGDKVYNLLLEYASGGTLSDAINNSDHSLSETHVRFYTRSIVNGLRHVHGLGYVHCDIKPENILLVRNEGGFTAKISDFGLAKKSECYGNKKKRKAHQPCSWKGTRSYLPPEAWMNGIQEAPSNIWALGCVVLEMLTGKPGWGENLSGNEIAYKLGVKGELPVIPNELSMDAKGFLKLCLARNPEDRCQAQSLLYHPFLKGCIRHHLNDLGVFSSGLAEEGMLEVIDLTGFDSLSKSKLLNIFMKG